MMFSLIMFSWSAMDGHFKREVLQMQPFRGAGGGGGGGGESYMKPQTSFWLDTMIACKLIFHVECIDKAIWMLESCGVIYEFLAENHIM